jgi:hypothetical protein
MNALSQMVSGYVGMQAAKFRTDGEAPACREFAPLWWQSAAASSPIL